MLYHKVYNSNVIFLTGNTTKWKERMEKNDGSEEAAGGKTVTEIRSMFEKKKSKENPYLKGLLKPAYILFLFFLQITLI